MALPETATRTEQIVADGRKRFTLDEANRAVIYVGRVVSDITLSYRMVVDLRQQIEDPENDHRMDALEAQYEQAMDRLTTLVDELSTVGVELKDFDNGQVDFPALHTDGREIYYCWQRGEDAVLHWHEIDEGFAGRQPVEDLACEARDQAA